MGTAGFGVASAVEKRVSCDELWQLFGYQAVFPRTDSFQMALQILSEDR